MVPLVLSIFTTVSLVLLLWQWIVALKFPLRKVEGSRTFATAISILKPLKGSDENTAACLESWFGQEYAGAIQLLFGVASESDPVCEVVRQLIKKYNTVDARLIICDPILGPNAKVSSLCHLFKSVRHELILISDADVQVPTDYLRNTLPLLEDSRIGLVHSFYQLSNPTTLAMRYEAIATNADFWSQVLQAASLKPVDFALGAVMITRRALVEKLNLFNVLKDFLADDYWMGRMISENGGKIVFSRIPVKCMEQQSGWRGVYSHQLRWARTVRVSQPLPYFFSILSNPTFWPLLWYISNPKEHVFHMVMICMLIRISIVNQLQNRLTSSKDHMKYLWLVPFRDIIGAMVWAQAFTGNCITWKDQVYRVSRSGKLEPIARG